MCAWQLRLCLYLESELYFRKTFMFYNLLLHCYIFSIKKNQKLIMAPEFYHAETPLLFLWKCRLKQYQVAIYRFIEYKHINILQTYKMSSITKQPDIIYCTLLKINRNISAKSF